MEINVDFVVPRVFHELNHYVDNLVKGGIKTGSKFVGKIGRGAMRQADNAIASGENLTKIVLP